MRKSRILDANMTLLLSMCFLINDKGGIRETDCFYKSFILNRVFNSFLGRIIRTLQATGAYFYLYRSFLLYRISYLCYCSIPINGLGGKIK